MFWPGEFHGLYSPWGRKESDRTEQLSLFKLSTSCGAKVNYFIFLRSFKLLTNKRDDNYLFLTELLEKAMATHSSTPVWKVPWSEEPDGLQSMGSQRIGHD